MKTVIKAMLIGAGARGSTAYAPYALEHPEEIKFVAVAEPDKTKRELFVRQNNISSENTFVHYTELLSAGIEANVVLICTQDNDHVRPAILALNKGYNVLLEKPISPSKDECILLNNKARETGLSVTVCHVLRYTPFFRKIKQLLEAQVIGDVVSITQNENVGYFHSAHSYVRGNWRSEALSSPMLLAKSCHDIDILIWLVGDKCKKVSSFGNLKFYRKENAPPGATPYCLGGCKSYDTCPFNAVKIYTQTETAWIAGTVFNPLEKTNLVETLKTSPYGRCVFYCDNDVVDHQATILEFENGVTASFHMNSLTYDISRTIKICGTKGELIGKMESSDLVLYTFQDQKHTKIEIDMPKLNKYGHGGGDFALMESLVQYLNGTGEMSSSLDVSTESHMVCFAAEQARHTESVVKMQDFMLTSI